MDYKKRKAQMMKQREKRWTLQEIGDYHGVSKARVSKILNGQKRGDEGKVTK